MIADELLKILVCPKCKTSVRPEPAAREAVPEPKPGAEANDSDRPPTLDGYLVCTNPDCALKYPVRDGIPVMLIDEAENRMS
ncbi:MAG: hypothetical protein JXR37_07005 [Kiritimatiellae bacterium]|nr:hypothetical protein [Kiritimatiellia bacterium]